VEKQMECRLAGETEVLGENLPQRHFCPSQNPTWPHPGLNQGRRGGKPATNRLSYGAAFFAFTYLFWCMGDVALLAFIIWIIHFDNSNHIYYLDLFWGFEAASASMAICAHMKLFTSTKQ
jgi:hypothetical protein